MFDIYLIHGLHSKPFVFLPMEYTLRYYIPNSNVYRVGYPTKLSLKESVKHVSNEIEKNSTKESNIILIGHSLGGIIAKNLHKHNWNIKKSIFISSPLKGSFVLDFIENKLPSINNIFCKDPIFSDIKSQNGEEPPHDYYTISTCWLNTEFDGRVFKNTCILNEEKHTHFSFSDHTIALIDPRVINHIINLIN